MWTHFRIVAGLISLIQIPYVTINTIYCGVGGLNKGRRSRQTVKMGSQNSTSILKILSSDIGRMIIPIGFIAGAFLQEHLSMPLLDDNFQNRCPILWYHFSDVDASVSLIHPPYATINSIYCGVGYLIKGYWCSDIPKMPQNSTSILKIVVKQWHQQMLS